MRKAVEGFSFQLAVRLTTLSIVDLNYLHANGVITKEVVRDAIQAQNAKGKKPEKLPAWSKNAPQKSRR